LSTTPAVPSSEPEPHAPTARGASRTVLAQVGARIVSLLAVVGSTAIVVRTVGIEGYADWGTVLQLIGFMAFAVDPGVSPIVVRRLLHQPEDAPTPAGLIPLRIGLALLALAAVVGTTVALRGPDTLVLALVLGGQVLPRAIVLNATPWLQIDQRLHRQTALEAVVALLGLVLLAGCALLDAPMWVLALVGFTGPTTLLALLMRRELRITPARARDVPGPQAERVRSVVREVAPLAGALVLVAVYMRIYVVFVNASEDEATIGRYVFAFQFVDQLMVLAGIVAGAMLPLLAVRARTARLLEDHLTHDLAVAATAVGALVGVALIALARPIVVVVGGPTADGAEHYLWLLAPIAPLLLTSFILAYVYVTIGRSRRYLLFNTVGLVVNVVAHVVLTLHFGADAAARITWGTEAVVTSMALAPLAGTASGRRAIATIVLTVGVLVVAGELAAADVLPALPVAVLAGAIVVAAAWRPLRWAVDAVGVPVPRRREAA
jgi:O-antigen/teichoic acid export membrane protein